MQTGPYTTLFDQNRASRHMVTVCISLYNYCDFIEETLESLRLQTLEHFDLVIIDDASTDGSAGRVSSWLEKHAERFDSVSLVRHTQNQGLPITRNTAVALADTKYCFIQDADNQLYPRCLEQCLEAAMASDGAVAFPILEVFGEEQKLLNVNLWSRRRFEEGNYIDAMALLDRETLLAVGGYSTMEVTGWEDFDLWCKLVERECRAVRVPEILARYRLHDTSMLQTITNTSANLEKLKKEIRRRHPWITFVVPASRLKAPGRKSPLWRRILRILSHPRRSAEYLWIRLQRWLARRRGKVKIEHSATLERFVELGWFDPDFYLETHTDLANIDIDPTQHFLRSGFREGRIALSPDQATELLKIAELETTEDSYTAYLHRDQPQREQDLESMNVGVYVSSRGNFYFTEIRDLLVEGFRRCGIPAQPLDEDTERPRSLTHDVIVAPHEFFVLGNGPRWSGHAFLQQSIMLNTEQLHTQWFIRALPLLEHAHAVIDMNSQSAAALCYLGIPTHFLPLGYIDNYGPMEPDRLLPDVPALRAIPSPWRSAPLAEDTPFPNRPIDVMYVGSVSQRRESFFAQHASFFSQYRCFFHISSPDYPLTTASDGMDVVAAAGISRRSKILLNIHRDEFRYFEWHRMALQGFWQKTLVVTEPCYEVPGLQPDVHYLSCKLQEMPSLIEWLLHTDEGRQRADSVRLRAFEALSTQFVLSQYLRPLVHHIFP